MLKLFKKISVIGILSLFTILSLSSVTLADNSIYSPLDDIKTKLEEDGIHVVDQSEQAEWGSLSVEDIEVIRSIGEKSLEGLSNKLSDSDDFEKLNKSRTDLNKLISEKSQSINKYINETGGIEDDLELKRDELNIYYGIENKNEDKLSGEERKAKNITDRIDVLLYENKIFPKEDEESTFFKLKENFLSGEILIKESEIILTTSGIKKDIKTLIEGSYEEDVLDKKVNLFFNEIDIYIRGNKWGSLNSQIISKLITAEYTSLKNIKEENTDDEYTGLESTREEDAIEAIKENLTDSFSKQEIDLIIGEILSLNYEGENQINSIVRSIVNIIKNLIGGLAVILIIINAMQMIFAGGDESIIKEKKQGIMYAVIGLIIILVLDQIIKFVYGTPITSIGGGGLMDMRNEGFSDEVYGIVSFIKAVIGSIAVFMIVISGIRMVTAQGEEEEIKKQKTSIAWVGVGIIIILINKIIIDNIFISPVQNSDQISGGNVLNIINLLGNITKFGLGFVGIIALGFLIYGAVLMIANYGNEEAVDKSKKIIKNSLIGIIIIISAYTIINTIIGFG